ncbi:Glycosyltransferase involved in cell wall bisynthesis [Noviherbaspirillum humi]|uniref:Glycosyltransferase involved in cell wall bisynthesis n=1 Tax=Noviherbaspirillum humi TaxID=1688639 RepID=A0A239J1S8_9BURK|nr:glycosyltransferase family 4 protein [Noviherbaspirillum humi]SNS99223.1 Glycosyltransferase involved in cell wall bisynthesis [Noviherbaspirillum humi]
MRPLRILTWHTHGSYLYYLTQVPHQFYVLSKPDRPAGYGGRCGHIPWGDNVIDMPVSEAAKHEFDCILFQDDDQYLKDQYEFLTPAQRALPRIYLEHDTPREHPTDMPHPVNDPDVLLVHVTHFNRLMWNSGATPTRVIEHGVLVPPGVSYRGGHERGLVVVNHLARRGRRLGGDVFLQARAQVPLDLVGMGAEEMDGIGEVLHAQLPNFAADYRFLFNPIRYTSLGLAVIEAMMVGVPVIGLATTEMATVIENGKSGYVDTNVDALIGHMQALLRNPEEAKRLGEGARRRAQERFSIARFIADWDRTLRDVTGHRIARHHGGMNEAEANQDTSAGAMPRLRSA